MKKGKAADKRAKKDANSADSKAGKAARQAAMGEPATTGGVTRPHPKKSGVWVSERHKFLKGPDGDRGQLAGDSVARNLRLADIALGNVKKTDARKKND